MKATSVPFFPRTSASDQVLPSTPLSEKSRAFQPKSQMPVLVSAIAVLHLSVDAGPSHFCGRRRKRADAGFRWRSSRARLAEIFARLGGFAFRRAPARQ